MEKENIEKEALLPQSVVPERQESLQDAQDQPQELLSQIDQNLPQTAEPISDIAQVEQGVLKEDSISEIIEAGPSELVNIIRGGNEPTKHILLKDQPYALNALPGEYNSEQVSNMKKNVPCSPDEIPKIVIGWEESLNKDLAHVEQVQEGVSEQKVSHWKNVTVIYVAIFLTWFGVVLGGGITWCLIVVACCSSYYQNTIERYRKSARDDAIRELWLQKLDNETESVAWLNSFLDRFWVIYEPGLSATIKSIVDAALEINKPTFLENLSLTEFRLGNKAPRINSVKTHTKTKNNSVLMDWDIEFQPNKDLSMTLEQIKNQINPKVVLQIRVGKGMVGAGLPVLVEDFAIRGVLRVRINFGDVFPHVDVVTLQFLERPDIDYVLKPVGGETFGFDIGNIPGLSSFIRDQIHGTLEGMMYAPNIFSLSIAQMMAPIAKDKYKGILKVNVRYAKDLQYQDGSGDPYVLISTSNKRPSYRTKTKNQTYNPEYNEVFEMILLKEEDSIKFTIFDFNSFRKDFECGSEYLSTESFNEKPIQNNLQLPLKRGSLYVGSLTIDCQFYPTDFEYLPKVNNDKTVTTSTESQLPKSGVLHFTLHQIKELDASKSLINKFTPYCLISINNIEKLQTAKKKRNNNPIYEESIEHYIKDINNCKLNLIIKDDRGMSVDPIIAKWSQDATKLIEQNGWYPLNNVASGKVKVTTKFYPLKGQTNEFNNDNLLNYFGLLKLFIIEAPKLRLNSNKSEVYIKVKYLNKVMGNTKILRSDLIPRWNHQLEFPIHLESDHIELELIEIINNEAIILGRVEHLISSLIFQKENGFESKGLINNWTSIKSKSNRIVGALHFGSCLFIKDQELVSQVDNKLINETNNLESINENKKDDNNNNNNNNNNKSTNLPAIELYPNINNGILGINFMKLEGIKLNNISMGLYLDGPNSKVIKDNIQFKENKNNENNFNCFIQDIQQERLIFILKENQDILVKKEVSFNELLSKPIKDKIEFELIENVKLNLCYNITPIEYHQLNGINDVLGHGKLDVTIVEAKDLLGVDSSGTSDPYVKVYMNDVRIFKTQTYKKNLNPKINESFTVPLLDSSSSILDFRVYDWNKVHSSESLGSIQINLDDPKFSFMQGEVYDQFYDLNDVGKGQLRLLLKYQKATLADEEMNLAVEYLKNAKSHIRANSMMSETSSVGQSTLVSTLPNTVNNVVTQETLNDQRNSNQFTRKEEARGKAGRIKVTIIGADKLMAADKGGTSDPYVKVKKDGEQIYQTKKVKKTLEPQWYESFNLDLKDGEPCWLHLSVMDHNRIHSDVPLGTTSFNIWEHLSNDPNEGEKIEFYTNTLVGGEHGRVQISLEYLGI
ncbi:hypothetical protein K502DRAFT_326060 [Neoconidiobolus thromboides FSU 785]|nr:hypothetical protein K502DRAFT_326060 [Neoconidiobolus thromboides FSU 785]